VLGGNNRGEVVIEELDDDDEYDKSTERNNNTLIKDLDADEIIDIIADTKAVVKSKKDMSIQNVTKLFYKDNYLVADKQ
jgi:hypothetical protein